MSGPSFAKETVLRLPTAVVARSPWEKMAQRVQRCFSERFFPRLHLDRTWRSGAGGSLKKRLRHCCRHLRRHGFAANTRAAIMSAAWRLVRWR